MDILKKVLTLLFPPIFREIVTRAFYYTKYLHYSFRMWKHPKALTRVSLCLITLVAIAAIAVSLMSVFAFLVILLIAPLCTGKSFSEHENNDQIICYSNGYEQNGVFYNYYDDSPVEY